MTRPARAPRTVKKAVPSPVEVDEPDEIEDDDDVSGGVGDDGRLWARFVFKDRGVRLAEPTDGQKFILVQTIGISDESSGDQEKLELALGFATMIRALFTRPADRQFVTGALARGTAEIEDYFGLAKDMVEYWGVDAEPPATNRDERRARERRPVAKAAVRPRR